MWQLLLPHWTFCLFGREGQRAETKSREVSSDNKEEDFLKLLDLVSPDKFRTVLYSFIAIKKEKNPNLKYWWQNMEMVGILLLFVKAQIEGIWELHLFAFQKMLPFFHRYI